jgi:hypothetical protein
MKTSVVALYQSNLLPKTFSPSNMESSVFPISW